MVVGRSECVLGHPPARGEDDEVCDGHSGSHGLAGQHREDARILDTNMVHSGDCILLTQDLALYIPELYSQVGKVYLRTVFTHTRPR